MRTKRIILYLGGQLNDRILSGIKDSDVILCAPGTDTCHHNKPGRWIKLPIVNGKHEQEFVEKFVSLYKLSSNLMGAEIVECFLNNYYSYSLRPVLSVIVGLKEYVSKMNVNEVLVLAPRTSSITLPLAGFKTSESLRGSSNLLAARIAPWLSEIFPSINFQFCYVKGDWLCYEWLRKIYVVGGSFLLTLLFIAKIIWLSYITKVPALSKVNKIILVRAVHQARFVLQLAQSASVSPILILPQIVYGKLSELMQQIYLLPSDVTICRVKLRHVLYAIIYTYHDICHLKYYKNNVGRFYIDIAGVFVPVCLGDIAREAMLLFVLLFYKNILSQVLRDLQPDALINFELVGNKAGLEALVARKQGIQTLTIQTALISAIPHPIFPMSERFYADSLTTATMLSDIGILSYGTVVYEGPPYEIKPVRSFRRIQRIGFFTQPYEHDITNQIIAEVCKWARTYDARVILRLHPRDVQGAYECILRKYADVLMLETIKGVSDIIENSDICITRTSSVAKEAIANGCPVLLCLWSSFDRRIVADYVLHDLAVSNCSFSVDDLSMFLNEPDKLVKATKELQRRIFGDKTLRHLSKHLFG